MAVPSSGQLREYADIGAELGVAQTNVSLRGMSQTAGFSTPDAMSEFYGYSSCGDDTLNIFGDNSCVAAYTYNQTTNGLDGVYNGTAYGPINYFGGQINYAAFFNGGTYIKNSSGYGIPINNNQVRSVSCWVKLDSGYSGNAADNFIWSSGKPQNGVVRKGLWFRGGSGTAYIGQYFINNIDDTYYPENTYSIPWDTWTHIVLAGNKWYKNGALWITMSAELDNTSDTYGMYHAVNGAYDYGYLINDTYGKPLRGGIDQLRVFNKVLSAAEVVTLYEETSCDPPIPPPQCASDGQPLGDSSVISHYQMENGNDSVGSHNLYVSSVSFGWTGKFNNSGRYYGNSSYWTRAPFGLTIATFTSPYSISFWAKHTTGAGNDQLMCHFQDERATNNHYTYLEVGLNRATNKYRFTARTNSAASLYAIETGTIVNDVWEMFTVSVASNNTSFYHNGNLVGSAARTNVFASDPYAFLYFGKGTQGWIPSSFWNYAGYIDQAYVFNRAITASEVTTLYNQANC